MTESWRDSSLTTDVHHDQQLTWLMTHSLRDSTLTADVIHETQLTGFMPDNWLDTWLTTDVIYDWQLTWLLTDGWYDSLLTAEVTCGSGYLPFHTFYMTLVMWFVTQKLKSLPLPLATWHLELPSNTVVWNFSHAAYQKTLGTWNLPPSTWH